jgi:hypothetical protein
MGESELNEKLKPHLPTNCGSVIVHVCVYHRVLPGIVYQPPAFLHPVVDS